MEGERINPRNMKFEYVLPSSWWTETADSHCLLLDVPGFTKEEVRIRTDNEGHVIVSGERQASTNKILHFEQSYNVPQGCNIQGTTAVLEDETYYVIIPKKINSNSTSVEGGGDQVQDSIVSDGVDKTTGRDDQENPHGASSGDDTFLAKLKKKRCHVLIAFLAFSLGLLVSHRYHSTPQKGAMKRADGDA